MTTAKVTDTAAKAEKAAEVKICHSSVCVGDAQPTNCVCPVTTKK
jgi:hypothetical protein